MTLLSQQKLDYKREFCFLVLNEIEKYGYSNCVINMGQMNYQQNFIKRFDEVIPDKDFYNLNSKEQKEKVAVGSIKPDTERYIFILFQLGIVEDWSVKEGQDLIKETYQVKANNLDDDELVEKLKNYIGKYEASNSERKTTDEKIAYYKNNYSGIKLKHQLIWYLLKWNYHKFVYNRRQSLKNLQEACEGYNQNGPKKFKETIDYYFRIDRMTKGIDTLLKLQNSVEMVAFLKDKITPDGKLLTKEVLRK